MSKIICHAHCPKGGHGGPGLGLIVAVAVLIGAVAAVRTAAPEIASAARTALHLLEIAAISVAGLAALALAGWAVHARHAAAGRRPNATRAVQEHPELAASAAQMLTAARKVLEIEAPKPYADQTTGVADVTDPAAIATRRNS